MNSLILQYSAAGWQLVPVLPNKKHGGSVIGKQWQNKATNEVGQLENWFRNDYWPAVLLGTGSGIMDIEADSPEANEAADELLGDIGTLTYRSKRSTHRIFRWCEELWEALGCKAVYTSPQGIELRMGGYRKHDKSVLGALSILPPATSRQWDGEFNPELVKEVPDEVIAKLVNENVSSVPRVKATSTDVVGGRNNKLTQLVGKWCGEKSQLGQRAEKEILEMAIAANSAFIPPLDRTEVETVVSSIVQRERDHRAVTKQKSNARVQSLKIASMIEDIELRLVVVQGQPSSYQLYSNMWDNKPVRIPTTTELLSFTCVRALIIDQVYKTLETSVWRKHWSDVIDVLVNAASTVETSPDENENVRFASMVYESITNAELYTVLEDGRKVFSLQRIVDRHPNIQLQRVAALLRECGFVYERLKVGESRRRVWLIDDIPTKQLRDKAQL